MHVLLVPYLGLWPSPKSPSPIQRYLYIGVAFAPGENGNKHWVVKVYRKRLEAYAGKEGEE